MDPASFYGERDPRELPLYSIYEAAHYLQLPPATLRSWVVGRHYPVMAGTRHFEPLIKLADEEERRMSFNNLVEAHVLSALRTKHRVAIQEIRTALSFHSSGPSGSNYRH